MSGRDLLYKPPKPVLTPEDVEGERGAAHRRADLARKVGVQPQSRDLGGTAPATGGAKAEGTSASAAAAAAAAAAVASAAAAAAADAATPAARAPAHQNAYFNADVNAARAPNQAASPMRALRGEEGAVDLDRVVLPGSGGGTEVPNPERLIGAGTLMGLDGQFELDLGALLARQSGWTQDKGVTVELLEQRLAMLRAMVEARKIALARMRALAAPDRADCETVRVASAADGHALDEVDDLEAEGTALVGRTLTRATGMHRRLAKILGIKIA